MNVILVFHVRMSDNVAIYKCQSTFYAGFMLVWWRRNFHFLFQKNKNSDFNTVRTSFEKFSYVINKLYKAFTKNLLFMWVIRKYFRFFRSSIIEQLCNIRLHICILFMRVRKIIIWVNSHSHLKIMQSQENYKFFFMNFAKVLILLVLL